jgi:hypothetical protein
MANPYRKLFNLFAFSVLAFAVYLNFFNGDDELPAQKKAPLNIEQAYSSPKPKTAIALQKSKSAEQKEEKKN